MLLAFVAAGTKVRRLADATRRFCFCFHQKRSATDQPSVALRQPKNRERLRPADRQKQTPRYFNVGFVNNEGSHMAALDPGLKEANDQKRTSAPA
jgi:hypothetical protein